MSKKAKTTYVSILSALGVVALLVGLFTPLDFWVGLIIAIVFWIASGILARYWEVKKK
jgi:uncharacterized membrane protein YphA (DoxX/SURF4 family)